MVHLLQNGSAFCSFIELSGSGALPHQGVCDLRRGERLFGEAASLSKFSRIMSSAPRGIRTAGKKVFPNRNLAAYAGSSSPGMKVPVIWLLSVGVNE
jgi:hypothetical protein